MVNQILKFSHLVLFKMVISLFVLEFSDLRFYMPIWLLMIAYIIKACDQGPSCKDVFPRNHFGHSVWPSVGPFTRSFTQSHGDCHDD